MDSSTFERVAQFVSRRWSEPVDRLRPETRLEDDLAMTGDDAAEFMADFGREFSVDLAGFEFGRHFGDETPANPLSLLLALVLWLLFRWRGDSSKDPVTLARLAEAAERGRWVELEQAPPAAR